MHRWWHFLRFALITSKLALVAKLEKPENSGERTLGWKFWDKQWKTLETSRVGFLERETRPYILNLHSWIYCNWETARSPSRGFHHPSEMLLSAGKHFRIYRFLMFLWWLTLHHIAMFHITMNSDRWYHPTCASFLDNYRIQWKWPKFHNISTVQLRDNARVQRVSLVNDFSWVRWHLHKSQISRTSQPQAGRLDHHCHVAAVSLLYRPQQCLAMLAMCIPYFKLLPCLTEGHNKRISIILIPVSRRSKCLLPDSPLRCGVRTCHFLAAISTRLWPRTFPE